MHIDKKRLQAKTSEMFTALKESGANEAALVKLNNEFQASGLADFPDADAIGYCIEKFAASEMDTQTNGKRGLGRTTEYVPRLGGYFRKGIANLSDGKRQELVTLIEDMHLLGYLYALVLATKDKKTVIADGTILYEKWIPLIYVFSMDALGESGLHLVQAVTTAHANKVLTFFKENNLKKGFFGDDKSHEIVEGYITAGITLRYAGLGGFV